jgi:serine/threonine protein kinase
MLLGIDYLHGIGVIHRDIKGGNILMGTDGVLKYCDFGLARVVDKNAIQMTSRVITRWYRAPELFLGEPYYDEKVDIWSIGCVFVELITNGLPPFKGDQDDDVFKLICARLPCPKPSEWPELEKMPNYHAFKGSLFTYNQKQYTSPQSSKGGGSSASSIPEFLVKYGHLWNTQTQRTPQMRSDQIHSPLAFATPEIYSPPQVSKHQESLAENMQLKELSEIVQQMLAIQPSKRPSARELLAMPFFTNEPKPCSPQQLVEHLHFLKSDTQVNEFFTRERIKANAQQRRP